MLFRAPFGQYSWFNSLVFVFFVDLCASVVNPASVSLRGFGAVEAPFGDEEDGAHCGTEEGAFEDAEDLAQSHGVLPVPIVRGGAAA